MLDKKENALRLPGLKKLLVSSKKFLKPTVFMSIGALISGGGGYVYQILMSRMLSLRDFVILTALMSAIAILSSVFEAKRLLWMREVAFFAPRSKVYAINIFEKYKKRLLNLLFFFSATIFISFVFGDWIRKLVNGLSYECLILGVACMMATVFGTINNAVLGGLKRFGSLAISGVATIGLKIILSFVLVSLGFSLGGAIFGAILATLMVNFAMTNVIRKSFSRVYEAPAKSDNVSVIEQPTVLGTISATAIMTVMTQSDILLANHFLKTDDAAVFCGVAILGKAILYVNLSLVTVLFPLVTSEVRKKKRSHIAFSALFFMLFQCLLFSLVIYFAGDRLLLLLFGSRFAGNGGALFLYSLAMIPLSVVALLTHLSIVYGISEVKWALLVSSIIQISGVLFFHSNIESIIYCFGIGNLGCSLALFVLFRKKLFSGSLKYSFSETSKR